MPSRRVKEPCPRCHHRNILRSRYCSQCGAQLDVNVQKTKVAAEYDVAQQAHMRQSEHRDIAHPITAEFRETIQQAVLETYEKQKSKLGEGASSERDES